MYLNTNSTTAANNEVLKDFIWCSENYWFNPSDISQDGLNTKNIIEESRDKVAKAINAKASEIVYTSGGSESSNWAIKGYLDKHPECTSIITTEIEHPSVYNTCKYLKSKGYKVLFSPIDCFGRVKIQELEELIIDNHIQNPFVSIMFSNNEIGSTNEIKEIAKIVHRYNGVLHTDAVQAFMHTHIDVQELGVDLMSVSFHKIGGFKGCGFLYIKDGIKLSPLIHGGKQFEYRRSGTENVPAIYACSNQVERLNKDLNTYLKTMEENYDYMLHEIYKKCGKHCAVYLNGHPNERIFNNISLTFEGINSDTLITLLDLKQIQISAGSACSSGIAKPSRTLLAIGLTDKEAFSTVRISFDYDTTKEMIEQFVDTLAECISSLKLFR